MRVRVNGADRELKDGTTVAELVASLGWPSEGVAVAVDRQVVPRSRHPETRLHDGAQVEILRAVGGG